MKTFLLYFALWAPAFQSFGQPVIRQATDTEAAAGADVKAFENPRQIQAFGGGGATNGQTAAQVAALIHATNAAVTFPRINTSSNNIWANFTNALQGGTSNVNLGSVTLADMTLSSGSHGLAKISFGGALATITDNQGVLFNDGSGNFVFTLTPAIFGDNVTAIPGGNLMDGTVNSNKLDAATRAMLGGGGGGGGGAYTNRTIAGANIVVTYLTNASGIITNIVALADPVSIGTLNVSNAVNVNTGNSNYFGGTNYMAGNVAPFGIVDNPTNSYQNASPTFVFTNGSFRTLIVGAYVANVITVGGLVRTTIRYTNNGVGYALPVCNITSSNNTSVIPFTFPLSPGGTFQYDVATSGTTLNYPTNVVGWQY